MRLRSRYALLAAAGLLSFGCQTTTTPVGTTQPLPAPNDLRSISLNEAIFLEWTDNAALSDPGRFAWYRVYSARYDLGQGLCGTDWVIEGTTISNEFLVALLTNGVPRCYATSAISSEGLESAWSPPWQDTPRPDARNVLVYTNAENLAQSGFRFWVDANNDGVAQPTELGIVTSGSDPDNDVRIDLNPADSSLWIVPVFAGTSVQLYSSEPIADLTSIDAAAASGYARDPLLAQPGFGYVFEIVEGLVKRYAGLRVTHVGRQYLIFDFSVQTDPGNLELAPPRGPTLTGKQVAGSR